MSTAISRFTVFSLLSLSACAAAAAPWLDPDDPRARYALQKLADRGHLSRSVTTWPVMWPGIESALNEKNSADGDEGVTGALAYLRFTQEYQSGFGARDEFRVSGTTETPFATSFGNGASEEGEAQLRMEWIGEGWAARLAPSWTLNPEDDETFRPDDSYLAGVAGNWVVGVGAIDRWWGPGWSNSLILSTNARPVPAVWMNRRNPSAPSSPWLNWLGPWQLTLFTGLFENDRTVPNAKLIGMRATFRPVDGLDIGLSRAIMVGGEGRSESASTFWDALKGKDNGQQGEGNDPGNQLGSIDIRYGFGLGQQSMSLYAQMLGEDEAGLFPSRKSWLLGTDWTTAIGSSEQQWYLEYLNTTADDLLGDDRANVTYEHSVYQSGYRYYGRSMGASLEGDAEAVVLGGYNFFANGNNLGASLTYAKLNKDGGSRGSTIEPDVFYNILAKDQTVAIATASYGMPAFYGWLTLNASFTDKKLELLSGEKDQWSLGAQWQYRF